MFVLVVTQGYCFPIGQAGGNVETWRRRLRYGGKGLNKVNDGYFWEGMFVGRWFFCLSRIYLKRKLKNSF